MRSTNQVFTANYTQIKLNMYFFSLNGTIVSLSDNAYRSDPVAVCALAYSGALRFGVAHTTEPFIYTRRLQALCEVCHSVSDIKETHESEQAAQQA